MKLTRFIFASLCALPILLVLYLFVGSWDIMPQDPPLPFWTFAFILPLWPYCVYDVIFQRDPSGIMNIVVFLITVLFWGFFIELIFMAMARMSPNKIAEANRH